METDTICALATANGNASIAVIRISGPQAKQIAKQISHQDLKPRCAHFASFFDQDNEVIDQGVAIYFPAPNSFTGEEVVELQSHGNPFVCQRLVNRVNGLGARQALAGEFSERAFLNGKLDLTQLEAIADLISSSSEQAAKSAVQSMQGKFSQHVNDALQQLIQIRTHIEASLDFSEEDIEIETREEVSKKLIALNNALHTLQKTAQQGVLLQQGVTIVLTGSPNVGKSSLFNSLCGDDRAIVTDIAGTTRDIVSADIHINGVPVHLLDTAGIRDKAEAESVEQEGISRAQSALKTADAIIHVHDATATNSPIISDNEKTVNVINKIDLLSEPLDIEGALLLSVKTGQGLIQLREEIIHLLHLQPEEQEAPFSARQRHLEILHRCLAHLKQALQQIATDLPLELVAEECRVAQQVLSEITGEFTPDDLLDYVFREFCIGK